jgi:hypothetical protein
MSTPGIATIDTIATQSTTVITDPIGRVTAIGGIPAAATTAIGLFLIVAMITSRRNATTTAKMSRPAMIANGRLDRNQAA